MSNTYFITGSSGFIGYFLSLKLLKKNNNVIGIDNMNKYYDFSLKKERLKILLKYKHFKFINLDISNKRRLLALFKKHKPKYVINLAAQAGVRFSIEKPDEYLKSNIIGFYNILEACRHYPVKQLIYASSSSVYGSNPKIPFEETDSVENQVSFYALTKRSNEMMAKVYGKLYNIPSTGLRFFTVYGPYGRPDMSYFKFANLYNSGKEITVYNDGKIENDLLRDFTYIDDLIDGIMLIISNKKKNNYEIINIGSGNPVTLTDFIKNLEKCFSKSLNKTIVFKKRYEPLKKGDVIRTFASNEKINKLYNFKPKYNLEKGLQIFSNWYCNKYIFKKK